MPLKKSFIIAVGLFVLVVGGVIAYLKFNTMQMGNEAPRRPVTEDEAPAPDIDTIAEADPLAPAKPRSSLDDIFAGAEVATPAPSPTPDTATPRILIKGRVIARADGAPIGGATAFLLPLEAINQPVIPSLTTAALATAVSDAEGQFTLRAELNRQHVLLVRKAGFTDTTLTRYWYEQISPNFAPIVLMEPGWTLRARVVDARTNAPIAGAVAGPVCFDESRNLPGPASSSLALRRHHVQGTSDAGGVIELAHLPRQAGRLPVIAPGYQMTSVALDPENPPDIITLTPGGRNARLQVVTSETNRPFANQDLVVQIDDEFYIKARTDAGGAIAIQGLPKEFRIWVSTAQIPWGYNIGRGGDEIDTSGDVITVKQPELIRLTGRVMDEPSGAPVTKGVMVLGSAFADPIKVELDAEGRFAFPAQPIHQYSFIQLEESPFVLTSQQDMNVGQKIYDGGHSPEAGGEFNVDLKAKPGLPISGTVKAADGTSVSGALILASGNNIHGGKTNAISDAAGAWSGILLSEAASGLVINASHPDYGSLKQAVTMTTSDTSASVALVFERPGRLWGEIVSEESGEPLPGIEISLMEYMQWPGRMNWDYIPQKSARAFQFPMRLVSDANGQFEFPPMQPGEYKISVMSKTMVSMERDVTVKAGERTFERFALQTGETITGRVVYDNGEAVPGAKVGVYVLRQDGSYMANLGDSVISGDDGYFQLSGLPREGKININAHLNSRGARAEITMPYDEEVILTFTRLAGVRFNAAGPDGAPVKELIVRLNNPMRSTYSMRNSNFSGNRTATRQDDGSWMIADVEPNHYSMFLLAADGWAIVPELEVKSGEVTDLGDITLKAEWGTARVTAVNGVTKEPIAGLKIMISMNRLAGEERNFDIRDGYSFFAAPGNMGGYDRNAPNKTTDENGVCEFEKIIPGNYSFNAVSTEHQAEYTAADVADGQTAEVTLTLNPYGEIRGVVRLAENGRPAAGASVVMNYGEGVLTDKQGRFQIARVPIGPEAMLTARLDNYIQGQAKVKLDPSADAPPEVEILLRRGHFLAGRVTNKEGEPIAGVNLHFSPETHQYEEWRNLQLHNMQAMSDANGRYRMTGLPPVPVSVSLNPPYRAEYQSIHKKITKLDDENLDFVLERREEKEFILRAVTADGEPVTERFTVYMVWEGMLNQVQQEQSANGEFRLQSGYYRSQPQGFHMVLKTGSGSLMARTNITLPVEIDERADPIDIVMTPPLNLGVRAIDESAAAITEAKIFIMYSGPNDNIGNWINNLTGMFGSRDRAMSALTDNGGTAAAALPAGDYVLIAMKDGFKTKMEKITLTEALPEVTLMMERGGALRGRVVDQASGLGRAGVRINVNTQNYDPQRLQSNFSGETNEEGWFEIGGLEPGQYFINAQADSVGMHTRLTMPREDGSPLILTIPALTPVPVLVIQDGQPKDKVSISFSSGEGEVTISSSGMTGADGRASISLPLGRKLNYNLNQDNRNLDKGEMEIPVSASPDEIVFNLSDYSLVARVTDEETGEALMGIHIQLQRRQGEDGREWVGGQPTQLDGTTEFSSLAEGVYKVIAENDKYLEKSVDDVVVSRELPRPEVSLALSKGIEMMIVLIDAETGERMPRQDSLNLSLQSMEAGANGQPHYLQGLQYDWNPDGTIRLRQLEEGEWIVSVTAGYYVGKGTITVSPSSSADPIPMEVEGQGRLVTSVNFPEGTLNRTWATLVISREGFNLSHGCYPNMKIVAPPGEYKWEIQSYDFEHVEGQLIIEALKDTPLTIDLTLKPKPTPTPGGANE